MNSYITFVLLLACVAISMAQYNHFGGGFSDGYFSTSFGVPGYSGLSAAAGRDPRANTGPVLFPPSPPTGPLQSSGVVPGASGYGFVPPGSSVMIAELMGGPNLFLQTIDQFQYGPALPRYYYRGFFLR
ncbi:uncharacterized protein LOC106715079 isoform X2 [Papilio machaon]|uniref:uncharacterized protein LOC106715079 isoform X2 n=1 Tax=Papilio machaon TaxID=76193 RepID=UPI001E662A5C|nr:uncharacterized protein LOC106715079 isoform X2 [Papilio machaon]